MSQIPDLWVEVFNATGDRQGDGYIRTAEGLTIDYPLDKIGQFTFQVPHTDPVASSLLTEEARVKIYLAGRTEDADKRLLISGVIREINASDSSNNWSMICQGRSDLDELTRYNVLLGLEYNQANHTPDSAPWDIDEIVDDLVSKVAGWSASITATGTFAVRFDGINLIQCLRGLAEQSGNHFRAGTTANSIEFGAFGASNGISLIQRSRGGHNNDPNKMMIESITIKTDTYEVVNRIIPLGATTGGDTSLTLESVAATRGTGFGDPYDIKSLVRNGKTFWYIEDEDSQTEFGVIEDIKTFDQIQVQSGNSEADIEAAANALYDAVVYYLIRRKDKITQYSVRVSDPQATVRAGDKIHLAYKGFIEKINSDNSLSLLPPVDINAEFWVMEVSEQYSGGASSLSLTLSSVDKMILTEEELIIGAVESTRIEKLTVKSYTNIYTIPFRGALDDSNDVTIDLLITNRMQKVRSVVLRLETEPFESYTQGAAAGGDHHHELGIVTPGTTGLTGTRHIAAFYNTTGSLTNFIFEHPAGTSIVGSLRTQSSSGDHTHVPVYGIYRDTDYPEDVRISINGVDRTGALGGPWGTTGSAVDLTDSNALDITEYITDQATLQKNHPIVLSCDTGQGIVRGVIEVYVDIQNLG